MSLSQRRRVRMFWRRRRRRREGLQRWADRRWASMSNWKWSSRSHMSSRWDQIVFHCNKKRFVSLKHFLIDWPLSCRARWINSWRKPTWPWWSGPTPGGSSLLKPSQSALVRTDLSQVSVFLSVWPWLCLPLRSRWWQWRWMWRGEAALLFWLRHALPHCLLEASVRLRPSHWLLERLGLLRCLYLGHRHADGDNWRPGITFWLHRRTQRLRHRCGVRGFGHICTRSDINHHVHLAASVINSNFTVVEMSNFWPAAASCTQWYTKTTWLTKQLAVTKNSASPPTFRHLCQ